MGIGGLFFLVKRQEAKISHIPNQYWDLESVELHLQSLIYLWWQIRHRRCFTYCIFRNSFIRDSRELPQSVYDAENTKRPFATSALTGCSLYRNYVSSQTGCYIVSLKRKVTGYITERHRVLSFMTIIIFIYKWISKHKHCVMTYTFIPRISAAKTITLVY